MRTEEEVLFSHREAAELLRRCGREVHRIARVCDDGAILFVGALERKYTAWLSADGQSVQFEEGFSAHFGSCSRVSTPLAVPPAAKAETRSPEPHGRGEN